MGRGWVCCVLALWLFSCGGRSESHEDDDSRAQMESGDDEPEPNSPSSSPPGNDVALPGCDLGARDGSQSAEECMWLADGRCYRDKLEACACICPLDHESVCSSGFPSDAGRTLVYCN